MKKNHLTWRRRGTTLKKWKWAKQGEISKQSLYSNSLPEGDPVTIGRGLGSAARPFSRFETGGGQGAKWARLYYTKPGTSKAWGSRRIHICQEDTETLSGMNGVAAKGERQTIRCGISDHFKEPPKLRSTCRSPLILRGTNNSRQETNHCTGKRGGSVGGPREGKTLRSQHHGP